MSDLIFNWLMANPTLATWIVIITTTVTSLNIICTTIIKVAKPLVKKIPGTWDDSLLNKFEKGYEQLHHNKVLRFIFTLLDRFSIAKDTVKRK